MALESAQRPHNHHIYLSLLGVASLQKQLQESGEVHLSALGIAISSLVTVGEIMKNRKYAVEKKVASSLEVLNDDGR